MAYYNTNYSATTGGFYSGFARPPTFDLNVEFESLGSCIKSDGSSNVTITATNFSNFDGIVWQKLNELTGNFEATNSTTAEFTPINLVSTDLKVFLNVQILITFQMRSQSVYALTILTMTE